MKPHKLDVRLLSIAQDDLYEVITYIGIDNPAASESLAAEIERASFTSQSIRNSAEFHAKRNSQNLDIDTSSKKTT